MIDGISSDPFSMKTLPPNLVGEGSLELIDKIRKQSRQRYAMEKNQLERLMDARGKKTFSVQEKIAEKAKYESLGMSEAEAENLQNPYIVQNESKFTEYEIDSVQPDAIIFDTDRFNHKAIRYEKPRMLENQANLKYERGANVDIGQGIIKMYVDIYQHQTITMDDKSPLMIWIGNKEDIIKQMEEIFKSAGYNAEQQNVLKFCPNLEKLKLQHPEVVTTPTPAAPSTATNATAQPSYTTPSIPTGDASFSIKDIKL